MEASTLKYALWLFGQDTGLTRDTPFFQQFPQAWDALSCHPHANNEVDLLMWFVRQAEATS